MAQARLYERIVPPSWLLGDPAVGQLAKGILFPSTRHAGGSNWVVYPAQLEEGDELSACDPRGEPPLNRKSWRCAVAQSSRGQPGSILGSIGEP